MEHQPIDDDLTKMIKEEFRKVLGEYKYLAKKYPDGFKMVQQRLMRHGLEIILIELKDGRRVEETFIYSNPVDSTLIS